MSKATAAAPPSTANEVPVYRPPRRQSPPTFDCRAATIKPQTTPLRDNHAPSIMPPPRRRVPILIVAAFSSRSPRDTGLSATLDQGPSRGMKSGSQGKAEGLLLYRGQCQASPWLPHASPFGAWAFALRLLYRGQCQASPWLPHASPFGAWAFALR